MDFNFEETCISRLLFVMKWFVTAVDR